MPKSRPVPIFPFFLSFSLSFFFPSFCFVFFIFYFYADRAEYATRRNDSRNESMRFYKILCKTRERRKRDVLPLSNSRDLFTSNDPFKIAH